MTHFTSAQSLLSLPGELRRPNPYQVFGLRTGESDSETIAAAIRATIRRLNEAKAKADPAAWKQAATWVTAARGQLSDPVTKQQLDKALPTPADAASSQVAKPRPTPRPASPTPVEPAAPVVDPLAGLLPGDEPSGLSVAPAQAPSASPAPTSETKPRLWAGRAVLPPSAPSPSSTAPHLATPPPTPLPPRPISATSAPSPDPPATAATVDPTPGLPDWLPAAVSNPVIPVAATPFAESATAALPTPGPGGLPFVPSVPAERRPAAASRRRSAFPWANAFLFLFAIACLVAVGGLIYAVSKHPQGLVISLQTGGTTGNPAQPAAGPGTAPDPVMARPGQVTAVEPADRTRPAPRRAARTRASTDQLSEADRWLQGLDPAGDMAPMADAAAEMPATPATEPPAPATPSPDPATPVTEPMVAEPMTAEAMAPAPSDAPSAELIEAGEAALKFAREAIGKGEWATMVELATAAAAAAVTEPQKASAARLEQLADVATYYHGGIEKGLSGLRAGESFNLTEQLPIVVVEITPEKLIVRFNGRNKEYARGELPLVMAHKLAGFSLPTEAPLTRLAADVYEAIAPVSTAQYRQKSLRNLEAMPEMVDDLRPADLVAAIRELDSE